MSEEVRSILVGTAGLAVAAAVALYLTIFRRPYQGSATRVRAAVRLAAIAVVLQAAHFIEEFATGFHQRFPELLGLVSWPWQFFVWFNLFWLAVWILGIWGFTRRRRAALFPVWFLAIACIANGVAHPLFSARTDGYFPGLLTSPLVGLIGFLLLRRLLRITTS